MPFGISTHLFRYSLLFVSILVLFIGTNYSFSVSRTCLSHSTASSTVQCFLPITTTSLKRSFFFTAVGSRNCLLLCRSNPNNHFATTASSSFIRPLLTQSHGTFVRRNFLSTFKINQQSNKMAELIDGNVIAAQIRTELKDNVKILQECLGATPGLAVVLVGDRKDSATYVRMKKKACAEVGVNSYGFDYPGDVTEAELLAKIDELNEDPKVNGILVQLPLPAHINENNVLHRIKQEKDVDGLHPLNVAQLANTKTHAPGRSAWSFDSIDFHVSCTPQGCIELLDRSGVVIEGKEAVVLGRSNIVGIPVALLLMQRNATVTIAHSRTKNLEETIRRADIVVAAVGRPEMVKGSWIKPGAVVIDVGINSVDDPTDKRGYKLVGDVNFEECKQVASKITPVPGGVGPMTIAMLLRNTVNGCRRAALAASANASLPTPPPAENA